MSKFFRTTPPGLLTDEDAGFLTENFAAVPVDQQPFFSAKLNEWQNFRQHYPRPLTPSEQAERQKERMRLGEIFTDFDKATQGDSLGVLQFADADNVGQIKQGLANRAFVQHMTGLEGDRLERDYELTRDALAKQLFGGTGVADDAAFHSKAAEWVTNENGKEEVTRSLIEAGRRAAAWEGSGLSESVRPSLMTWQEAQTGKPGYDIFAGGEYEKTFKAAQAEAKADFDRLRPYVDAAWLTLTGGAQTDVADAGAVDFEALADRLMELPAEDRRKTLAMVKGRAELLPEKDQSGFWKNVSKSFRRQGEAIGQGLVNELPRITEGIGAMGGPARERQALYEDIRNLQRLDLDPIVSRNGWESAAQAVAGSLPGLAAMWTLSPFAMVGQYASDARQTVRTELEKKGVDPAVSGEFANGLALPAAVAMSYLEKVTLGMANGIPGVKQLQAKLLTRLSETGIKRALAVGGAFALESVEQNVQEALQDTTPLLLTEVAETLGAPIPEVEAWGPAMQTMTDPSAWAVSLVFAGMGFGRMPDLEAAAILRERGASNEQIQTVLAAPDADSWRVAVTDALTAPANPPAGVNIETESAGQAVENAVAGVTSVTRDAEGWWVEHADGRRTKTDSVAAAQMLVTDLAQVNTQDEADAMVELADSWAATDPRAKQTFTGEKVTAGPEGVFTSRDGQAPRLVPMSKETAAELDAELELLARAEGGDAAVTRVVAGANSLEYRRGIGEAAQTIVETLNTKQNVGGDVITQVHERVEATWRAALDTGAINMAETFRALRRLEAALGRAVLSEDPSEAEVRETVSEMVAADVLGRRKDGKRVPAGAISKGLTAAIESAVDPAEKAALGQFRAFLRAVRAFWRNVFKTVAAISKARREGKLTADDEWGTFVDKLMGVDTQKAHEAEVAKEAGAVLESSETFSVRKRPLDDSDYQQYFDFNAVPKEKAKKGKAALKAAGVGAVPVESGGAGAAAVADARAKAERAWRGLVQGTATADDRKAALAAIEQGPVSSILHEFVRRDIPVFQIRGAKVNNAADFWQLALAVRSPFFESIKVAVLDEDNTVLGSQIVLVGALDEALAPLGQIIAAVDGIARANPGSKAKGWIISHNHPSGDPRPSQADIDLTARLKLATEVAGLPVLDHVVTNGQDYFSFAENGMLAVPAGVALAPSPGVMPVDPRMPRTAGVGSSVPGKLADWEVVERGKLTRISSPSDIHSLSNMIKTADPDHAHIIYLGTKHQVMAVERVEMGNALSQLMRGAGREGSKKAAIVLPTGSNTSELRQWITNVAQEIRKYGISVVDVASFDADYRKFVSAKEQGLFEADAEFTTSAETFSLGRAVTPAQDAEYIKAIEGGDMETAQRMVDEAAKKAGYDSAKVMHGTSEQFNTFDKKRRGYLTEADSAKIAFFFTDGFSTAESYAKRSATMAEDKEVKILLQKAEAAQNRGDWDAYEKLILQAEEIEFGENASERKASLIRNNSYIYQVYLKGDFLELDAEGHGIISLDKANDFKKLNGSLVSALKKAKRIGKDGVKIANFDDSMGASEVANHWAVFEPSQIKSADPVTRDESGNVIPLSQRFNPADDRITFSLSSATGLERLARQIANRGGTPRAKARIWNRLASDFAGMARAVELNEGNAAVVRMGEIREQARQLRAKLVDQYEEAVLAGGAGEALAAADLATVRGQPFMAWLTDSTKGKSLQSRLMSRTRAAREGRYDPGTHGDYDGASGIPAIFFNGNQMPDQVAQEAFEAGVLSEPSVELLWDVMHKELAQVETWRKRVRAAETAMMQARQRAATEARQWEQAELAKAKANNAASADRDAKRALVILDRMLMALPAEVRAKVGGFTRVAELKSNDARFKYFAQKVTEIDRVLERHLRETYLEEIRDLFKQSRPKMAAGEKDRGKLGVNAHAWMTEAERIMGLSPAQLEAEEDAIEKRQASATLSEDVVQHYARQFDWVNDEATAREAVDQHAGLLNLFGGLMHRRSVGTDVRGNDISGPPIRTAGEMFAALEAAQEMATTGRLDWFREIMVRRERRARQRETAISEAGGLADAENRKEANKQNESGLVRGARDYANSHFSFEGFTSSIFGEGSGTHQWADQTSLDADLSYRDGMRAREQALGDFLRSLWPRSTTRQRQRNLEKLATSKPVPNAPAGARERMSELDAVHYRMLWMDEDTASREWLESHGYGQQMQDAMEAMLSDEAKAIRSWLVAQYDAQYDQINAVYRRMYGVNMPRVKNYAPRLVDHGGQSSDMAMDPLQEGRQLMAGFTKRRRLDTKSPPRQLDALTAYWQNAHAVEYWTSWAESMSDFRAVFSHWSTQAAVKASNGDQAGTDLNEWVQILERNGVQNANGQGQLRKWSSAMADYALVGKLGVLAKQMVAGYASASQLGIPEYLGAVGRITRGEASITLADVYRSDTIQRRMANISPEVRTGVRGRGLTPLESGLDAFLKRVGTDIYALDNAHIWLRDRIGWFDAVFTTLSAAAAYDVAFREATAADMAEADAREAASARMETVVADSAQPDAVRDKSLSELRGGLVARLLMPFQSANRQGLGMTMLAVKQKRWGDVAQMAVVHWVATGLIAQTIGNIVRTLLSGDDVEDVWEWEDYARSIVIGPLTGARYLGMVIEGLAPFFGGFERRQAAVPMSEGLRLMRQAVQGDFDFKSITDTLSGVGLLVGGRTTWAAITANILKQAAGLADTVTRTDAEREAEQAKEDKATIKEAEAKEPKPEKPQEQKDAEKARRRAREAARAAAIREQAGEQ